MTSISRAQRLLIGASGIGDALCRSSLWERDQCTWPVTNSRHGTRPRAAAEYRSAGAELYQGTSGISLFLLELWKATGDQRYLRVATGGLQYAISQTTPARSDSTGFYVGSTGPAYVAARFAALTQEQQWADASLRIAGQAARKILDDGALDIIGGAAGAVLAFLRIGEMLDAPRCYDYAIAAGDHALATAHKRPYGWSWRTAREASRQDLCGYAHGSSGFAHAFLELYAHSGEVRWAHAAVRALDYERHHAIPETDDWPDFRHRDLSVILSEVNAVDSIRVRLEEGSLDVNSENLQTMRAWCHGAPGMALTRIRALSLGIDVERCTEDLTRAVRATEATFLETRTISYSLCHGLFGNAESILVASQQLGRPGLESIVQLALDGIDRFQQSGWPSGSPGHFRDPSLMIGDAGIGYHLLRLYSPQVPSVLLLTSWRRGVSPQHDDIAAESRREITEMLSPLHELLGRATTPRQLTASINGQMQQHQGTEEAIYGILSSIDDHATEPTAQLISDCVLSVKAAFAADRDHRNYSQVLCERLLSGDAFKRWKSEHEIQLSKRVAFIRTRFAWSDWESGTYPPAERSEAVLIVRTESGVERLAVTSLEEMVLRALVTPGARSDLFRRLRSVPGGHRHSDESIAAFVQEAIRLGLLVCPSLRQ